MTKLPRPLTGSWPFRESPPDVCIGGRHFVRARIAYPYDGVRVQYREATERDSHHLLVLEDGTYRIDHTDSYNPDYPGNLLPHLLFDTIAGPMMAGGIAVALTAVAMKPTD